MKSKSALIILDMLNLFNFSEADMLIQPATKAAKNILRLKNKFKKRKWPVIYVNDHFGHWHSDWKKIYQECSEEKCLGRNIARLLKPDEDDYFILKPKHSGFFMTALELLLEDLKIQNLVLTGIAGNLCVLFTAHDAHMREYKVTVPRDCIASNSKTDNDYTLRQLKNVLGLSTPLSSSV